MSQSTKGLAALTLGAIGVVYGDIGTSPLYTVKEVFAESTGIALTQTNIIGAISAIFWALMFVVSLKYVLLVLRADNKGEGGIMALLALAASSVKKHRSKTILFGLGVFGAALFYGDSILTPAISVLSAVEGLSLITPKLTPYVLPISIAILIMSVATICLNSVTGTGNTRINLMIEAITIMFYCIYIYVVMEKLDLPIAWGWGSELLYWSCILIMSFSYLKSGKWDNAKTRSL